MKTIHYSSNLRFNICEGDTVIARVFMATVVQHDVLRLEVESGASLLKALRGLPREHFHVDVMYPTFSTHVHPFNQEPKMDIAAFVPSQEPETKEDVKVCFVAPLPEEVPDDGVLSYRTIETIYDVASVEDRQVMLFHPLAHNVLKCLAENTATFKLRLVVLSGLPGSLYSAEFEKNTWNLERASYPTLINDIKHAAMLQDTRAAQNMSQHDRERAQYTRSDGSVKAFKNVESALDDIADSSAAGG